MRNLIDSPDSYITRKLLSSDVDVVGSEESSVEINGLVIPNGKVINYI
jgi:hypothetical protein